MSSKFDEVLFRTLAPAHRWNVGARISKFRAAKDLLVIFEAEVWLGSILPAPIPHVDVVLARHVA